MRESVGLRFRYVLLFFYKCVRTRAGPDVSQLCSTSKQYLIQKEQEKPSSSLPSSIPLSPVLCYHEEKKKKSSLSNAV